MRRLKETMCGRIQEQVPVAQLPEGIRASSEQVSTRMQGHSPGLRLLSHHSDNEVRTSEIGT